MQPDIGAAVHFVGDDPEQPCQAAYVHGHMGIAHLVLAAEPVVEGERATTWFACPSDTRERHSWHTECGQGD